MLSWVVCMGQTFRCERSPPKKIKDVRHVLLIRINKDEDLSDRLLDPVAGLPLVVVK